VRRSHREGNFLSPADIPHLDRRAQMSRRRIGRFPGEPCRIAPKRVFEALRQSSGSEPPRQTLDPPAQRPRSQIPLLAETCEPAFALIRIERRKNVEHAGPSPKPHGRRHPGPVTQGECVAHPPSEPSGLDALQPAARRNRRRHSRDRNPGFGEAARAVTDPLDLFQY